eukprot:1014725-Pelagomonas_calceolata.AAC.8
MVGGEFSVGGGFCLAIYPCVIQGRKCTLGMLHLFNFAPYLKPINCLWQRSNDTCAFLAFLPHIYHQTQKNLILCMIFLKGCSQAACSFAMLHVSIIDGEDDRKSGSSVGTIECLRAEWMYLAGA